MNIGQNFYDVIIVGGGPAGLSSAIYMARARYRVLVVEKQGIGGQITITEEIVNYPGIEKTSGKALTEAMYRQAKSFGAEFVTAEVLDMELTGDVKLIRTTHGEYRTLGVILAPGANPRKLGFKGEQEFQGRGVAYCATCDGEFFTGREVFVIGGGYAAVEEGIFLTKYAKKVTIVVRKDRFSCAKSTADQLKGQEKIDVMFHTEVMEAGGEQQLSYVRFKNNETGEEWTYEPEEKGFGIFVFAGYIPNTAWISPAVERDESGYLLTDKNQKTNLSGVYAAGDVCVKNLRQVVTAVSDGAVAATSLEKAVSRMHEKLEIPEYIPKAVQSTDSPISQESDPEEQTGGGEGGFLNTQIKRQLKEIFAGFSEDILLKFWRDDSALSEEMAGFIQEVSEISDRIRWEAEEADDERAPWRLPALEVCKADGKSTGIVFHGVPGGHEFNSFVLALYNVSGPGQQIDPEIMRQIQNVQESVNLKILVSLSCTMCPETVASAQKAASLSDKIQAEMFDLSQFPDLKEQYQVMSVPCLVVNDSEIFFGKKGLAGMAELLAGK